MEQERKTRGPRRPVWRSDETRMTVMVSMARPEGATEHDIIEYVRGEVQAGCGTLHPDDPMSRLDRASVRVRKWLKPEEMARVRGT